MTATPAPDQTEVTGCWCQIDPETGALTVICSAHVDAYGRRALASMTATPAPALTAAEADVVARFAAAPYPVEVAEAGVLETVARALWVEDGWNPNYWDSTRAMHADEQDRCRRLAAAAIAAYRAAQDGGAEEAVRRVEALCDEFEKDSQTDPLLCRDFGVAAKAFRAALATQAGDE